MGLETSNTCCITKVKYHHTANNNYAKESHSDMSVQAASVVQSPL